MEPRYKPTQAFLYYIEDNEIRRKLVDYQKDLGPKYYRKVMGWTNEMIHQTFFI